MISLVRNVIIRHYYKLSLCQGYSLEIRFNIISKQDPISCEFPMNHFYELMTKHTTKIINVLCKIMAQMDLKKIY